MHDQERPHWVVKLLAIWMFAYAANTALFFLLNVLLAIFPGRQDTSGSPWHGWRLWTLASEQIIADCLRLLPTPDLLLTLRAYIVSGFHLINWAIPVGELGLIAVLLTAAAIVLGVGLLRGREWARWTYLSLCCLSLLIGLLPRVTRLPLDLRSTHSPTAFGLIAAFSELVMPIVLLIFLIRRGLMVTASANRLQTP